MNTEILTETENRFENIRKIVKEIKRYDEINYGKISEMNKKCDITEEEWKVDQILLNFSSKLDNIKSKFEVINEKVNRDIVKIFLFGKVSVGKSTLLNTMLGDNYFASGTAHTTSSFVHVKKSEDDSYRIKTKDTDRTFTDKKEFIKEIEIMSGDIKGNKATANENIEVSIRMDDESLLKKGIEIVDCPGSGNKSQITDCIKKNSQEADIFIFVLNYALTDDDRVFFKYQEDSSTKPDVFIVINQWDESDNDDEESTQMSKEKINEECSKFLQDLDLMKKEEISERIYFLSSSEMFQFRIENDDSLIKSSKTAKKRFDEFTRFEYNLKKYISAPQDNKTRRYTEEIKKLQTYLCKECKDFKENIFKEKRYSLISKYRKLIEDLKDFKKEIKLKGERKNNNIIIKVENLLNDIMTSPNVTNTEWVTTELGHVHAELDIMFKEVKDKQYKEFVSFLKNQEGIGKESNFSKEGKPAFKSMWRTSIVKPSDKGLDVETADAVNPAKTGDVLNKTVEILPLLGQLPTKIFALASSALIISGLAMTAASAVYASYANDMKVKEQEQQKQNIIQQLDSKKNIFNSNIKDNVEAITEHFIEKANEINGIFQRKIDMFNEYWSKIEEIFRESHEIIGN